MKRMMFKAFGKKLFGTNYERMARVLMAVLIVFLGLKAAEWEVRIAPSVLYFMTSSFTAGVMWQALSSKDTAETMQNLFMLPFAGRDFIFSYVVSLGIYVFLTKTAMLLAVVLALGEWRAWEILGSICCAASAILMAAAIRSVLHHKDGKSNAWAVCACCLWTAAVAGMLLLMWNVSCFIALVLVNGVIAVLVLRRADAYSFYEHACQNKTRCWIWHDRRMYVWRYLLRYLGAHKNYVVNMAVMWGVACVLPSFLGALEGEGMAAQPVGFAVLSMNTPICILLSCDPDLEQAVRVLPHQGRLFCVPYVLFLFLWNGIADVLYLCSWQIQLGGITGWTVLSAACFALLSAVLSVLLEWFYPVRGWKIESDLWHHPRKYLVPAGMLLLAGMYPVLLEFVKAMKQVLRYIE